MILFGAAIRSKKRVGQYLSLHAAKGHRIIRQMRELSLVADRSRLPPGRRLETRAGPAVFHTLPEFNCLESHMIKRFIPLILMLAWAPGAFAYPACKPSGSSSPLTLWDPSESQSNVALWFLASYTMYGDQSIINEMKTGKCKDRMPVLAKNVSNGITGLNPGFSPINGFGVLSLPELPTIAIHGLNLRYRLDLKIDNAPLLNSGDWMDVAQLDFAPDRGLTSAGWPASTVYRVRKIQRRMNTFVQVIEARDTAKPASAVNVIAEIPLNGTSGTTAIALRWTQRAQAPSAAIEVPEGPIYYVDSTMEVLGMKNPSTDFANVVIYSIKLPREWANTFSSGLLDYNVPDASAYSSNFRVDGAFFLDAETF